MVKYLLDPGGDGGGVNIPGVPGTNVKPPSKDGVLDGTSHYGEMLAPAIAIVLVAAGVIWLFRNVGNFIGDLIKRASLLVGGVAVIGIFVLVMMMSKK